MPAATDREQLSFKNAITALEQWIPQEANPLGGKPIGIVVEILHKWACAIHDAGSINIPMPTDDTWRQREAEYDERNRMTQLFFEKLRGWVSGSHNEATATLVVIRMKAIYEAGVRKDDLDQWDAYFASHMQPLVGDGKEAMSDEKSSDDSIEGVFVSVDAPSVDGRDSPEVHNNGLVGFWKLWKTPPGKDGHGSSKAPRDFAGNVTIGLRKPDSTGCKTA